MTKPQKTQILLVALIFQSCAMVKREAEQTPGITNEDFTIFTNNPENRNDWNLHSLFRTDVIMSLE